MEIEYTPTDLARFSVSQLRDILEDRGKSLNGTKWELIERILNLKISRRKTISSLPSDVLQLIGSYLKIDDICRLCLTSKKFNQQFCRNFRFWKSRLLDEFPRTKIEKLEDNQFREEYWKKYAEYLQEKTSLIQIDVNRGNPKLPQLEGEIKNLRTVLNSLINGRETLEKYVREVNIKNHELSRRL